MILLSLLTVLQLHSGLSASRTVGGPSVSSQPPTIHKCCKKGYFTNQHRDCGGESSGPFTLVVGGRKQVFPTQEGKMPKCRVELDDWYPDWNEITSSMASSISEDGILVHDNYWFSPDAYCVELQAQDWEYSTEEDYSEVSLVVSYCPQSGGKMQRCDHPTHPSCVPRCCQPWSHLSSSLNSCTLNTLQTREEESDSNNYSFYQAGIVCGEVRNSSVFSIVDQGELEVEGLRYSRGQYCLDRKQVYYCEEGTSNTETEVARMTKDGQLSPAGQPNTLASPSAIVILLFLAI